MAEKSAISWTATKHEDGTVTEGATWNAVIGCSKVSPGCTSCYAETLSLRYGWSKKPWTAPNAAENVVLKPHKLDLPLRWTEGRRIFVNSLSDVWHDQIPDSYIDSMFAVMAASSRHTYQILTKRPKRMQEYIAGLTVERLVSAWFRLCEEIDAFMGFRRTDTWIGRNKHLSSDLLSIKPHLSLPLSNVWLGTSCEDQRRANERIPLLLQTPAVVHFLSLEPLLGPIDLKKIDWFPERHAWHHVDVLRGGYWSKEWGFTNHSDFPAKIDQVIVGGESGSGFRPLDLDWARQLRDDCTEAGVPFFYKQGSGLRPGMDAQLDGVEWHQFPGDIVMTSERFRAAG